MDFSRDSFCRFKDFYETGGALALVGMSRRKSIPKNRVAAEIEAAAVELAIEQPIRGQVRVSNGLRQRGLSISAFGVRRVWQRHDLENTLYLAVEDIDHTRTRARRPQTNGICERFHRTVLDEFYRVAFRKMLYRETDGVQADLDAWIRDYNVVRTPSGALVLRQDADADLR